jgi:gliding motility-associated-like protein
LFSEPGQIYVTLNVQDENGCECITGKYLTIYDNNHCFIPTVFSPNQDNLNEVFQPILSNLNLDKYLLIVFDRWGKETFTSSNYEEAWDGTFRGEDVISGAYIYKLNYQTIDGSSHSKTGTITLIR